MISGVLRKNLGGSTEPPEPPLEAWIRPSNEYNPNTLRRVQITPKKSTNITRYLYFRELVRRIFSHRASDELDWSYIKKNGEQFKSFFRRRRVGIAGEYWSKFISPTGSSKYGTTHKNTQQYNAPKRLHDDIYSLTPLSLVFLSPILLNLNYLYVMELSLCINVLLCLF